MNKRWTDTERDFLKRHYNDLSTEDIALKLDKTKEQANAAQ